MFARRQMSRLRPSGLLMLLTMAGLLGLLGGHADSSLGQPPAHPAHPTPATPLDGAPPDPDAIVVSPDIAAVLDRSYPRSVEDLRVIERQVERVLKKVVPATVGIQLGSSAGSGVIISPDGLILTAGHVSGEPGRTAFLLMPDGRRVRGRTLGLNRQIDSGLMRIVEEGPWPYVEMAPSREVESGQWVIATGHPGGYLRDRTPPVRLGRVLYANDDVICTDCTLVGGDSGGPLFNMRGEVIGIHSRIGRSVTSNFHVPIATYHDTWDRLAAGEVWGGRMPSDERGQVRPYLGLLLHSSRRVTQVAPGTPAARAGMQVGDVVVKFDGAEIADREAFVNELWTTRPGQRVELEVQRGEETVTLRVRVGGTSQALPGSPEYEPREPRRRQDSPEASEPDNSEPDDSAPHDTDPEGAEPGDAEPMDETPAEEPKGDDQQGESDPAAGQPEQPHDEAPKEEPPPADPPQAAIERLRALGIELDPVSLRCVVAHVASSSAADAAGLRAGDVIRSVDGDPTPQVADLLNSRHWKAAEGVDRVNLQLSRNGREVAVVLQLPKE